MIPILSIHFVTTAVAVLLTTLTTTARGASQCYFPNGRESSSDVPCDPSAEVSMCCPSRAACLSSGLCANPETGPNQGISYARGTCTDKSWRSAVCPQRCRINQDTATNSSAYDFGTDGVQVWECVGQGYAKPGAYCCESAGESTRCCRTQTAVFSLPAASVGNALAVQTPPAVVTTMSTSSGSSSSSSSPSETGSTTTVTVTVGTTTGTTAGGKEGTQTGGEDSAGGGLSDAAKIGLGVGIGIGAAALIVSAILVWCWRRGGMEQAPPKNKGTVAEPHDAYYSKPSEYAVAEAWAPPAELPWGEGIRPAYELPEGSAGYR
ncbi:uncharacterized protein B0T15DRAFT_534742 [Chaetomium strumarium]|uniref:Mid2 domain-containing protein n=1 Tax=Chaetomium strumarium TaxID=1170767 RepID=A0AAJ0GU48_9PEZI|nr:hypothetical protein B0T15DRAFT_534742 [Chaetomium strumarium]